MNNNETLDMSKRLIAAMQMGILIYNQDGHRWIECVGEPYLPYDRDVNAFIAILEEAGICINNKIYGSHREALFVIDEALQKAGSSTLLERFHEGYDGMKDEAFGEPNPKHNRISNATCLGGIF